MKRFRVFYGGLAGLAAACALGAWFAPVEAGWLAFPWVSIGAGLRTLSLSGSVGNVAACGLYALLCLLPAGIALRDIRHHWPLVGFSAVLGPALYFLINPGLLAQRMGGLPQEVVVAMLGQLIWAVALACAVWLLLGALHRRPHRKPNRTHPGPQHRGRCRRHEPPDRAVLPPQGSNRSYRRALQHETQARWPRHTGRGCARATCPSSARPR